MTLTTILLLAAFVSFVLAALNVSLLNLNLIGLGLALWVLTLILGTLEGLGSTVLIVLVIILIIVLLIVLLQRGALSLPARKKSE